MTQRGFQIAIGVIFGVLFTFSVALLAIGVRIGKDGHNVKTMAGYVPAKCTLGNLFFFFVVFGVKLKKNQKKRCGTSSGLSVFSQWWCKWIYGCLASQGNWVFCFGEPIFAQKHVGIGPAPD